MENVVELNAVMDIEEYISKYKNIEKLLTVLEDNYLVTSIDKYSKEELAFEMSIAFPLIQGVISIIGDLIRDTNDKFNNAFNELVKVCNE